MVNLQATVYRATGYLLDIAKAYKGWFKAFRIYAAAWGLEKASCI